MNTTANTTVEKFTPGPWHWLGGNAIWDSTNHLVSTTVVYKEDLKGYDESKCVQNAKLIAAAPDMYEALKEVMRVVKETWGNHAFYQISEINAVERNNENWFAKAHAAIKKATE